MSEDEKPIAKEPIVLDAEGHVLHDPEQSSYSGHGDHRVFGGTGILPKLLIGGILGGLLLLGLTLAGVVLAVLVLGFIGRLLFFPKTKRTRR